MATRHRFRPRFAGLAWSAIGIGAGLVVLGAVAGPAGLVVVGGVGAAFGAAHFASAAWRLVVTVDDAGLAVGSPGKPRFALAWADVVEVVASPTTGTCFVDGGTPARSLLVPGDGAPASYDLEDKATLYRAIIAGVGPARVREVARLDTVAKPAS